MNQPKVSNPEGYENNQVFEPYALELPNGRFQGSARINIDLSEYSGKTVDVVFAAVPKLNTQSLVLLFCFEDVVIL
jgi:hypothetical protein